ncbi:hypothetical protein ZHAS_00015731 [Anopheles sinensis]|uniref:Uncharacterized protein n=1 Tax=Anopheles sinensis TaxID=74873 RepID=A0A084WBU1_ANOSI|nr:hypothetical protein ZHAS_00015731 [Anopheles sinensis]
MAPAEDKADRWAVVSLRPTPSWMAIVQAPEVRKTMQKQTHTPRKAVHADRH